MDNYNTRPDMKRHPLDDFIIALRNCLQQKEISKDDPILDLGSGNSSIHENLPEYKFVGIDLNPVKVGNNTYITHDLNSYPYPLDKKFKTIICADVMEHLLRPDIFLENIIDNLLEEDGTVIGTVPNCRCIDDVVTGINISIFRQNIDQITSGRWCPDHIRFFDFYSLERLFKETGFSIEYMGGSNCQTSAIFSNIISNISGFFNVPIESVTRIIGHSVPDLSPNILFVITNKVKKVIQ